MLFLAEFIFICNIFCLLNVEVSLFVYLDQEVVAKSLGD